MHNAMCTRARPSKGLGSAAALVDGLLHDIRVTLAVARMGRCVSMRRMGRVGEDGPHDMACDAPTGHAGVRQDEMFLDICPSCG